MGVGSSIVTCSILVGDGDNGRGHACLGKNIWEILVPFPQFCCKRKLLLKKERKKRSVKLHQGLPWWFSGKESICQGCRFDLLVGKIPWRGKWQPTPAFLPEKSHGQRSLVGCSPWSHKELDMTECARTQLVIKTAASLDINNFKNEALWRTAYLVTWSK